METGQTVNLLALCLARFDSLMEHQMESIRLDEEAVLKTVGCKSLEGASPSLSAIIGEQV